jgi:hypothetical protein
MSAPCYLTKYPGRAGKRQVGGCWGIPGDAKIQIKAWLEMKEGRKKEKPKGQARVCSKLFALKCPLQSTYQIGYTT